MYASLHLSMLLWMRMPACVIHEIHVQYKQEATRSVNCKQSCSDAKPIRPHASKVARATHVWANECQDISRRKTRSVNCKQGYSDAKLISPHASKVARAMATPMWARSVSCKQGCSDAKPIRPHASKVARATHVRAKPSMDTLQVRLQVSYHTMSCHVMFQVNRPMMSQRLLYACFKHVPRSCHAWIPCHVNSMWDARSSWNKHENEKCMQVKLFKY